MNDGLTGSKASFPSHFPFFITYKELLQRPEVRAEPKSQGEGKNWKQKLWVPNSLQMVTAAMKLKDAGSFKEKL